MFEDPNAGGGVTSDPPVGTGGTTTTSDPPVGTGGEKSLPDDVSGFEDPALSDPTVSTEESTTSDPPVGTGG